MAQMYLSIFEDVEKVTEEALKIEPASLYCAFEQVVTDGRKARGKRYPLALLLTLLKFQKTGGRNDREWDRRVGQGEAREYPCSVRLAQTLSGQFDVE